MTHKTGDQPRPAQPTSAGEAPTDGVLPAMFRLGDDSRNHEMLDNGKRILSWQMGVHDVPLLAGLAGWDIFPMTTAGRTGFLYLPAGTRNAPSVLSGIEAWSGEKRAVVERVGRYLAEIHENFGIYDTGFSWNQVGITPDQDIFVAPPNAPPDVPEEQAQAWQKAVVGELGLLLQSDAPNGGLVGLFEQSLQEG